MGLLNSETLVTANATSIDYAARLWLVFRAVIAGALDEMKILLGDMASQVMETIERHEQYFFVQALQLDPQTLRMEAKRIKALKGVFGLK